MKDNTRTAIGYFCTALVFISYFFMMAWILSPQEFTIKLEMDENTREAIESIEYPIVQEVEDKCSSRWFLWNNGAGRDETNFADFAEWKERCGVQDNGE